MSSQVLRSLSESNLSGFIDVHSHFAGSDMKVKENWQLLENLAFGVTTLHNPSGIFFKCKCLIRKRIQSPFLEMQNWRGLEE